MANKKNPNKTQSKADFVRSLPDMSAKDVVAKAAQANMTLSEAHVHVVRSSDKTRAKKKNKATKSATTVAKSSSTKKPAGKRGRKSKKKGIVLKLLAENPTWAAEKIAKTAGCSVNYVHTVKRENKGGPAKTATVTSAKKPAVTTSGSTTEFYRVLKRIGVDEAKRLIAAIEDYARA